MLRSARIGPLLLILGMMLFTLRPLTVRAASALAPVAQDAAGTYISDVIAGGEAEGMQIVADLADDGTATVLYYDENGDESKVETGEWSEEDGSVTITITGDSEGEYDSPIEMVFEIDGDTLVATDYDTDMFGEDGLTLTYEEVAADDSSTGDSSASDVITLISEDAVDANDNEISVTLEATDTSSDATEGSIVLTTETADGETLVEIGTWSEDTDDTVLITLTGTEEEEYDEPVEITLAINNEDQTFSLIDATDDRYGEDGVLMTIDLSAMPEDSTTTSDDESTPPGLYYSSSYRIAENGSVTAILIQLTEEGAVQINTNYFDGQLPVVEVGEWVLEEGVVTMLLAGTLNADGELEEYEEPVTLEFEFSYDSLSNYDLGLYMFKLSEPYDSSNDESSNDESIARIYSAEVDAADGGDGATVTLVLYGDATVTMMTEMSNGDVVNEYGEYSEDESAITVTLQGDDEGEYDETVEYVFDITDDGLSASEYDTERFGEEGMELVAE